MGQLNKIKFIVPDWSELSKEKQEWFTKNYILRRNNVNDEPLTAKNWDIAKVECNQQISILL